MKIILQISLALLLTSLASCSNNGETMSNTKSNTEKVEKLLRHVVLFSFNDQSTEADITKVQRAFSALQSQIPQIYGYEWGLNNSPEGLNKGFTHCFFLTFKSEEDRAIYLPHPDHKAFGDILGPHLKDVLVVDYWTE